MHTNSSITTAQQVVSPVYKFGMDNNGVIVALPQVSSTGATSLGGTLTFGIGTQSNNQLTAQNVFTSNGTEQDGSFTTTYDGVEAMTPFLTLVQLSCSLIIR